MTTRYGFSSKERSAANINLKEKEYWMQKLAGEPAKSYFPYDRKKTSFESAIHYHNLEFRLDGDAYRHISRISNNVDQALHMILTGVLLLELFKYSHTGNNDIIVSAPIYKRDVRGDLVNKVLVLRNQLDKTMTFKQLLGQVRQGFVEAAAHQNYPMGILLEQLGITDDDDPFPIADISILLEGIHDKDYILHTAPNLVFSFSKKEDHLAGVVEYNSALYDRDSIETILEHYINLAPAALSNLDAPLADLDLLTEEERHKLLVEFNDFAAEFPRDKTIHQLFREQVERNPDNPAVIGPEGNTLTYGQLDKATDRLAALLRRKGVTPEKPVGFLMKPSPGTAVGLMGILKSGGAYLPIDPILPPSRITHMLKDSCAPVLLSDRQEALELLPKVPVTVTPPARHIQAFNDLPMPDRSLIDLSVYKNKIGMAAVTNAISIQATRGCPYKCIYCHKVWSKYHVYRGAENMFEEVQFYYKKGVRDFAFIDDCFNLNMENSSRFFKLVLKHKLDIQILFPNGLRGDIMTPDYIDLMTEAGCRGINLSLETASPRLQKLLKKNLDIDKFRGVMEYIAQKHPEVILEIATMHGFPTETEEEAMMTLDFIKSIKWLHFPYIHILKVYPNTEMEDFALEYGVSKETILRSKDLAFHELPDTLPWPKSFTRQYQSDFMNNYFLDKERLAHVLPVQMEIMNEEAMAQKYNTYLPTGIRNLGDILEFTGMEELAPEPGESEGQTRQVPELFTEPFRPKQAKPGAKRLLLLDLTRHFSSHSMLYNVSEQPLGLIYLMTYINRQFGDTFDGRIYKSGEDFDSYEELKQLTDDFQPDLIGIRCLTFYKDFFHETTAMLRQFGITVPIIAGGPYAVSDYDTILKDKNVGLVVFGEGEYIMAQLLEKMLEHDFKIPPPEVLDTVAGLAYAQPGSQAAGYCELVTLEPSGEVQLPPGFPETVPEPAPYPEGASPLAYILYTSGTTGLPKGVMIEHRSVINCLWWMQDKFPLQPHHQVVQRTPLTFDPSVWEVFWPLVVGAACHLLPDAPRRDAGALIDLLVKNEDLTVMYCTASLVTAIASFLRTNPPEGRLKLPYFITGAEPIAMETVRTIYHFLDGRLVNTYGPTEGTINNTWYPFEPDDKRTEAPIGKPVANNRVYILREDLRPVPMKAVGEICLAGDSLARGYLNNPDLTVEKFVWQEGRGERGEGREKRSGGAPPPIGAEGPLTPLSPLPSPLYKTGDLGRWMPDGQVQILTRTDEQLKLRGYRIEPGEVEAALISSGDIDKCVVIAADGYEWDRRVQVCKTCGLTTKYPNVTVEEDGTCNFCRNFSRFKEDIDTYFKTPEDLKQFVLEAGKNAETKGDYDCLILYNGGRGAGYALYQLVDLGLKVLAVTYDNGYFSKKDIENIEKITSSLGVDHDIVTHPRTDFVLKRSLEKAHTVCRGCFHISSSLAANYANTHNIPVTIGATLSRGQIIENKLLPFLGQDFSPQEVEAKAAQLGGGAVDVDKDMFDLIGIKEVSDGSVRKHVKGVDFFRYFDVTNQDMIRYLNNRDPYWIKRKDYAVYSTNCAIKQLGDFGVLWEAGGHYYGAATSWEKRLGHLTLENLEEDLTCTVTAARHDRFLEHFGLAPKAARDASEKFMAAYVVSQKEDLDTSALREKLAARLPEYMVPAYITPIDEIPLTPNGKVDRSKLPDPRKMVAREAFVAPTQGVQQALAETWSEVLGVDKIGIDDNFFQVGGDSIKAIQVAAKLVPKRMKLEIGDLFNNPTIRELEDYVKPAGEGIEPVEQNAVKGEVPLTPIQHWFFQTHAESHRHHFNQSILLFNEGGFREPAVRALLAKVVEHHDALRMVYQFPGEGAGVVQRNRGIEEPLYHLEVHEFDGPDRLEAEIEPLATGIQSSMDLDRGPLLRAGLFKAPGGDHLLIAVHHLVVDGVSWRILMEDLADGYQQAEAEEDIIYPGKTHAYRQWAEKLQEYARGETAAEELSYWASVAGMAPGPLPVDHEPAVPLTNKTRENVPMELDESNTSELLTEVHKAYNTEINDILLAALGLAVYRWNGAPGVAVTMEGHGREDIIPGISVARTVGWFTSRYPVIVETGDEPEVSTVVKSVKEMLHKVPNRGVGYGILRYLAPPEVLQEVPLEVEPSISFNYLGRFGGETGCSDGPIGMSPLSMGEVVSSHLAPHAAIDINGMVSDGGLRLTFSFNRVQYDRETVERLTSLYRECLVEIINHCMGKEETEMTVSDYGGSDLDDDELDAVFDELDLE